MATPDDWEAQLDCWCRNVVKRGLEQEAGGGGSA